MPKDSRYNRPVPVRFTPEDQERVEQAAKASGHTRSGFVRHAALIAASRILGPVDHCNTDDQAQASGAA